MDRQHVRMNNYNFHKVANKYKANEPGYKRNLKSKDYVYWNPYYKTQYSTIAN